MPACSSLQRNPFTVSRPWFWLLLGVVFFLAPAAGAPREAASPRWVTGASADAPALVAASVKVSQVSQNCSAPGSLVFLVARGIVPISPARPRLERQGVTLAPAAIHSIEFSRPPPLA